MAAGACVKTARTDCWTALMLAVDKGHPHTVEVESPVKPCLFTIYSACGNFLCALFYWAGLLTWGPYFWRKALLAAGANIEAVEVSDSTALGLAALRGDERIVKVKMPMETHFKYILSHKKSLFLCVKYVSDY